MIRYVSRRLLLGPYIGLCQSAKDLEREARKLKVDAGEFMRNGYQANTRDFTNQKGDMIVIVCIQHDKNWTNSGICGLLVHESVHVVEKILRHMGERKVGEETRAYMTQNVAQELIAAYRPSLFK